MRVAITGATGLIGTALVADLRSRGHEPVRIVRSSPTGTDIPWDPAGAVLDANRLVGIDAVVNLAGPGIGDHRWTARYKRELRDARVAATTLIAESLATISGGPATLVSASGVDYYGADESATFDETSPRGAGFLADLCADWEASTAAAAAAGIRVATVRTGLVLSARGGALGKMLPLFRFGLGGRFGSGRQWQSWISIDDYIAATMHILEGPIAGPVNLTSPHPVTNAEFAKTLGRVLRRPAVIPVPKIGPMLLFGRELVDTLLYSGHRVVPRVLEASDFTFTHPDLEPALRAVLGRD